jgi:hypothetical protein
MIDELKITIAVIAAVSALSGTFISQIATMLRERSDRSHKRNVLLREKYEEMVFLITSGQEWMGHVVNAKDLSELMTLPPVNARKALVLANIYFPKLRDPMQQFLNASVDFQKILIDNHEFLASKSVGVQAAHKNRGAYETAAEKCYQAIRVIDDSIVKYSGKYARA